MNIRYYIVLIWFILSSGATLSAQISFERQVISPFQLSGTIGNENFHSTGGQPAYSTIHYVDFYLTQGFEQPLSKGLLNVNYDLNYNPCTGVTTINIIDVTGCENTDSVFYRWNDVAGTQEFSTTENVVKLSVLSDAGCSFLQFIDLNALVANSAPCKLEFFNFITPNGDQTNDEWHIKNIEAEKILDNKVEIYNRWGEKVWEASRYNNADIVWIGNNQQGVALPDGTYYYVVLIDGDTFKGYIELTR